MYAEALSTKRQYAWPEGHWGWPIKVTHKHGVRCGDMAWVGGQVDFNSAGDVLNAGDLFPQTRATVKNIETVLRELDLDLNDLVYLKCFYANDGSVDECDFLNEIAAALPKNLRVAYDAIPLPYLAYEGMVVEIEAIAMRAADNTRLPRRHVAFENAISYPDNFCAAVSCGRMIYVSAVSAPADMPDDAAEYDRGLRQIFERIGAYLGELNADLRDLVKLNRWFADDRKAPLMRAIHDAHASYFKAPGPAAFDVPIPRIGIAGKEMMIGAVAMVGRDGEHLPRSYASLEVASDGSGQGTIVHGVRCEEMVFVGNQTALSSMDVTDVTADLSAQTYGAMKRVGLVLEQLGAGFDDVCKVMAHYRGDCGGDVLHDNLPIRSSHFSDPGPTTTGVPVHALPNDQALISVDVCAMLDKR